ncbi:sensor domain-containing diguanylate cyclase [Vibrio tapetis]|uniref:diguanylate cyclase n=1 Tax=Vibrio tapetis subsp. tapetis TaxID=1671868 RepID=A0A2N8ZB86_9VIBR|nr:sensor domain-containing diguanylate cyclase [Vibrio tapetis]SON49143.1 putative GGDEF family protein [Vibrio tapetis subsp. tapetis]
MIKKDHYFSLRFIALAPAAILVSTILIIIFIYIQRLEQAVEHQYKYIETSLTRAGKIATTIDYSLGSIPGHNEPVLMTHDGMIKDGLCRILPKDAVLRSKIKNDDLPSVEIDYMIVGRPETCKLNSPLYQSLQNKITSAKLLSFFQDIDFNIDGVRFVDRLGFVISSPRAFSQHLNSDQLDNMIGGPAWQKATMNRRVISVFGPHISFDNPDEIISVMTSVYSGKSFEGVLTVDLDLKRLLNRHSQVSGDIKLIGQFNAIDFRAVSFERELKLEGMMHNHALAYQWHFKDELVAFLVAEKYALAICIFLYSLVVVSLFYFNSRIERTYYKRMASHDPMTGLLNRRGMENYWYDSHFKQYLALATLDVDDFKTINDRFGHDVGDDAICYVANQMMANISSKDAVARFGGEEFVVCVTGEDKDALISVIERLRSAISEGSCEALDGGCTLSGGLVLVDSNQNYSFSYLLKQADRLLYQAKTTGKNKLISSDKLANNSM